MSMDNCKVIEREELESSHATHTRLVRATYLDANSVPRKWEYVERRTRQSAKVHGGEEIDGVGIIAILEKDEGPEIVLVKQFRPAMDKTCVEVPAGLVDKGERAEDTAIRELKEETGYVGVVDDSGPVMWNNPGLSNTTSRMVRVKVDLSLPENQNPQPLNEEDEFIEVFTLPLKTMWQGVKNLEDEGYGVDQFIVTLAEGIRLAKRYGIEGVD